ncbi:MAG: FAD:protein FMN transferase [Lentisphaeria bacterium]|nr:FAD:protein FMN transferase [Lentisphaeria bacterium]
MKKNSPITILLCSLLSAGVVTSALFLHYFFRMKKNIAAERIHSRQFPVMGTAGKITLYNVEESDVVRVMDGVQEIFYHVEKLCSIFNPESALYRINASAEKKAIPCPEELFTLLEECSYFHKISSGAFDVSIRPLMLLWGFYRKRNTLPDEKALRETLDVTGFDKVVLDRKNHTVSFRKKGVSLDLGGIAKGYALDLGAAFLRKEGVKKFVLDLGGNLFCFNENTADEPFRIGIRSPENPHRIVKTIFLRNGAIATSGDYERYVWIGGKRYTHIMDPRTGKPVSGIHGVTVLTPRGLDSDVYSTMIFVLGKVPAEIPPGTKVWIFKENKVETTGAAE